MKCGGFLCGPTCMQFNTCEYVVSKAISTPRMPTATQRGFVCFRMVARSNGRPSQLSYDRCLQQTRTYTFCTVSARARPTLVSALLSCVCRCLHFQYSPSRVFDDDITRLNTKASHPGNKVSGRSTFEGRDKCVHSHRAALGIEPRTSRTQSENHTTRPSSQLTM